MAGRPHGCPPPDEPRSIHAEWVDAPGAYLLWWDDWTGDDAKSGGGPIKHTYD
ncbi:hypothetical protein ACPZ19_50465 [Amycolatopsis lurida]